jgi:hypothetical protein
VAAGVFAGRTAETESTGLEPATSGVTGRHGATGYNRPRPGITGYSRHFLESRTGYDRLRPATTRQGLCSTCVVDVLTLKATWLGSSTCDRLLSRLRHRRPVDRVQLPTTGNTLQLAEAAVLEADPGAGHEILDRS